MPPPLPSQTAGRGPSCSERLRVSLRFGESVHQGVLEAGCVKHGPARPLANHGVDSESSTLVEVRFLALMVRGPPVAPLTLSPRHSPGGPLWLQRACHSRLPEILARTAEMEDCRAGVASAASPFLLASEFQISSSSKHT